MARPKFARPKSLYIEAVGIMDDGTETVVRMKLDAVDDDSTMTLSMDTLFEDVEDFATPYAYSRPNDLHNIKIEMTRASLGNLPDPVTAS